MKTHSMKLFFGLLILVMPAVFIISCNKKDSTGSAVNTNPGCGEGVLCGKLDTSEFVSDQYAAGNGTRAIAGSSNGFSTLVLTAVKASTQQTISMAFTQKPQTGHTYTTGNLGVVFTYINLNNGPAQTFTTDPTSAHSGSVTVTKFDTTANLISGSFSFTAASTQSTTTHSFSNGAFTDVKVIR